MKEKRRFAILGSTGSIGTQTLEIIREQKDLFEVEVLSAQNNADLLIKQALEFNPNAVVIGNKELYPKVKEALNKTDVKVFAGADSLCDVVTMDNIDIVITALMGSAGLKPTLNAIKHKKIIALANKETLVMAGELVMKEAYKYNVPILPIDSEHSAIFQCLIGDDIAQLENITITGSGGPFRGYNREMLKNVTPAQALKHPTWNMGKKISIDSASLMNKGLEMIEAKWLFNLEAEQIQLLIHPESIIHSMVEFKDGSTKAQLSFPNMKGPIQYAMSFPNRLKNNFKRLNLWEMKQLTFENADSDTFKNLALAQDALKQGGNMPCILNAANEIAVEAFLNKNISFLDMSEIIEKCMLNIEYNNNNSLDDLIDFDKRSRELASSLIKGC